MTTFWASVPSKVGDVGLTDVPPKLLAGGLELIGGLPLHPAAQADGDRQAEPVEG
jgi:hypothetical protein